MEKICKLETKISAAEKDHNVKIIKSEQGIQAAVFDNLQGQINKFFKNYALE